MTTHRPMPIPPQAKGHLQAALPDGRTLKACVLVDDTGELYACFDPPNLPTVDLHSGVYSPASAILFEANPTCWVYFCSRYGCFWIPVPC